MALWLALLDESFSSCKLRTCVCQARFLILRMTLPLQTATYHVSYIAYYTVGLQVSCILWIWGHNACHAMHCLFCLQVDSSDTASDSELSQHFIRYTPIGSACHQ